MADHSRAAINEGAASAAIEREFLYGTPGAEHMEFDPESVLADDIGQEVEIEEWTVRPPHQHLPDAASLLDWLADSDFEVTEGWWESATDATADPEVMAAAQALLDAMASKITFRMADRHIATLRYRWEGDDLDGEFVMVSREVTAEGKRLAEQAQNGRSEEYQRAETICATHSDIDHADDQYRPCSASFIEARSSGSTPPGPAA